MGTARRATRAPAPPPGSPPRNRTSSPHPHRSSGAAPRARAGRPPPRVPPRATPAQVGVPTWSAPRRSASRSRMSRSIVSGEVPAVRDVYNQAVRTTSACSPADSQDLALAGELGAAVDAEGLGAIVRTRRDGPCAPSNTKSVETCISRAPTRSRRFGHVRGARRVYRLGPLRLPLRGVDRGVSRSVDHHRGSSRPSDSRRAHPAVRRYRARLASHARRRQSAGASLQLAAELARPRR